MRLASSRRAPAIWRAAAPCRSLARCSSLAAGAVRQLNLTVPSGPFPATIANSAMKFRPVARFERGLHRRQFLLEFENELIDDPLKLRQMRGQRRANGPLGGESAGSNEASENPRFAAFISSYKDRLQQGVDTDGLGKITGTSRGQAFILIVAAWQSARLARRSANRHPRRKRARGGVPVHHRHLHVHEHQIELFPRGGGDAVPARSRRWPPRRPR